MKRFTYEFTTSLHFSAPVIDHYVVLRCLPMADPTQRVIRCGVSTVPHFPLYCGTDGFGNRILSGSCRKPHGQFTYCGSGRVEIDHSVPRLEKAHPMYRHPGLLTRPDQGLRDFAQTLPTADPEELALAVYEHFQYTPGATSVSTTAAESFALGKGVCQDYAHVLLALCRLKGIPARYCMGITEGEGVTHAWVEVYRQGQWVGLDPTRNCGTDDSYLRFAVGRDAQDCPVERGVFRGNTDQLQTVFAAMNQE